MTFFAILGCETERIAPKPIETDMDKLRMKFSALNVDFDGPSLDFLDSRKFAHDGIKERYLRKSRYFYRCCPVTAIGFSASREHWLKFLV